MNKKLKDKVVLITGSSSGIGEAIALLFAEEGADVIITSNKAITKGKEVLAKVLEKGSDAIYVNADLSKEEDINKLFNEIEKKYKRLDVLINNAGATAGAGSIDSISFDLLDKELKTNLYSTVICTQKAMKLMINGGNVVNTSSIRGLDSSGRSGIMGYSLAKASINNFTKTVARELAPNIIVNAVVPGFVETENYKEFDPKMKELWLENTPIKRFIKPSEIAEIYLLLALTKVMTGSLVVVDGGTTLLGR